MRADRRVLGSCVLALSAPITTARRASFWFDLLAAEAGRRVRLFPTSVVLDAQDLAVAQDDDLEEPRDEALRAEPLEPPSAQLHEHPVAEVDHLTRAQTVRLGAPEQRAHDVVDGRARIPLRGR